MNSLSASTFILILLVAGCDIIRIPTTNRVLDEDPVLLSAYGQRWLTYSKGKVQNYLAPSTEVFRYEYYDEYIDDMHGRVTSVSKSTFFLNAKGEYMPIKITNPKEAVKFLHDIQLKVVDGKIFMMKHFSGPQLLAGCIAYNDVGGGNLSNDSVSLLGEFFPHDMVFKVDKFIPFGGDVYNKLRQKGFDQYEIDRLYIKWAIGFHCGQPFDPERYKNEYNESLTNLYSDAGLSSH